MPEKQIPEEFNRAVETQPEVQTLNPSEAIKSAQDFFRSQGLTIDETGLVSPELSEAQLQQLAAWHESTRTRSVDMPTEDLFYKKVLLGISLWRQEQAGKINYLLGKGVGAEISLRGTIEGRVKRTVNFPYRSHSDFELYAAYNPDEGEEGKKKVYTKQFVQIFGSQEYFPTTDTKGLKNLPPQLLHETAETVDLGGVKVKVPQLELQFLDKWNSAESTPRTQGNDAELLARQYVLDRELVRRYLREFIIQRTLNNAEQKVQKNSVTQFSSITRLLKGIKNSLIEEGEEATTHTMVEKLSQEMENYLEIPDVSVGGINVGFWIPIKASQIDIDGNIIDDKLKQEIIAKIIAKGESDTKRVVDRERQMDELFDRIEKDYSNK